MYCVHGMEPCKATHHKVLHFLGWLSSPSLAMELKRFQEQHWAYACIVGICLALLVLEARVTWSLDTSRTSQSKTSTPASSSTTARLGAMFQNHLSVSSLATGLRVGGSYLCL